MKTLTIPQIETLFTELLETLVKHRIVGNLSDFKIMPFVRPEKIGILASDNKSDVNGFVFAFNFSLNCFQLRWPSTGDVPIPQLELLLILHSKNLIYFAIDHQPKKYYIVEQTNLPFVREHEIFEKLVSDDKKRLIEMVEKSLADLTYKEVHIKQLKDGWLDTGGGELWLQIKELVFV